MVIVKIFSPSLDDRKSNQELIIKTVNMLFPVITQNVDQEYRTSRSRWRLDNIRYDLR